jgi:DNA-binding NtrC family response regulator
VKRILVIDDDQSIRRSLELHLSEEGHSAFTAGDGAEGLEKALSEPVDLVLLDLRLPALDGFEVLRRIRERKPRLPVVVITAYDDMQTAIEAIRLGAADHLGKPLDLEQLDEAMGKIFEIGSLSDTGFVFHEGPSDAHRPHVIVGRSKAMKSVYKTIGAVADSEATVLIQGESGTGKELVARALHVNSRFAARPFVAVTCSTLAPTLLESELFGHEKGSFTGAISAKPGKFEVAQGGTLFLDEIAEVSPNTQVKLLRFLQEREFERVGGLAPIKADVRVVAATNKELSTLVSQGSFREDLYYRLRVVTIELPPLRARKDDIPLLVQFFLDKIRKESGRGVEVVPERVMECLLAYPWPGNVRELENALRRAVLLSPGKVLLPETLQLQSNVQGSRLPLVVKSVQEVEKEHIENILAYTGFEKKRAAEILNVSRPTLDKRIREYGIRIPA